MYVEVTRYLFQIYVWYILNVLKSVKDGLNIEAH